MFCGAHNASAPIAPIAPVLSKLYRLTASLIHLFFVVAEYARARELYRGNGLWSFNRTGAIGADRCEDHPRSRASRGLPCGLPAAPSTSDTQRLQRGMSRLICSRLYPA